MWYSLQCVSAGLLFILNVLWLLSVLLMGVIGLQASKAKGLIQNESKSQDHYWKELVKCFSQTGVIKSHYFMSSENFPCH